MHAARSELRMLVTSAGRRVELIECFRDAADSIGVALVVIACDQYPELSAACHRADMAFAVPPVTSYEYVPAIAAAVRTHGIGLVVPTIDPELLPLARSAALFADEGAQLALSGASLVAMCTDKLATANFLARHRLPSPRTLPVEEALAKPLDWPGPLFVKPRYGSASRGVRAVDSLASLDGETFPEPMLAQALLAGSEYTINMFFDREGSLCSAIAHERLRVRGGEVEKGITRRNPRLLRLARDLAAVLPEPRGALCFQAMVAPDGTASIFEINARFGGGYPLAHRAGANFARWLIEESLARPVTATDDWQADVMMLRYDSTVFVAP
ncbi:carbamoyl phosphate synthase large subunit [Polymorphobacter glacialis]|uniref:Carbamoyl phosphate synthase large subunit n=1 Tax=Sandarakinorhabdus glacialis TaxID=1614636 RepID=A0A917E9Q3_9SPHN|nr:ATP-grasp domain-containing protein [Polymorphobacter glacialis]GGE14538.1 carbamoyl phosphate synthase large subunit [Polymorphobacter glacialis]